MPSYIGTIGTSTLVIEWTASAGTAAQTFVPTVTYRCVTDDEVFDSLTTPNSRNASSSDALIATNDLHQTTITLTNGDFAANDTCWFQLFRDVSEDSLAADAKVVRAQFNIQW